MTIACIRRVALELMITNCFPEEVWNIAESIVVLKKDVKIAWWLVDTRLYAQKKTKLICKYGLKKSI